MTADDTHRYRNTVIRDREGNVIKAVPPDIDDVNMPRGVNGHPAADMYRAELERVEREFDKQGGDVRMEEWLGLMQAREYLIEIDNAEIEYLRNRLGH